MTSDVFFYEYWSQNSPVIIRVTFLSFFMYRVDICRLPFVRSKVPIQTLINYIMQYSLSVPHFISSACIFSGPHVLPFFKDLTAFLYRLCKSLPLFSLYVHEYLWDYFILLSVFYQQAIIVFNPFFMWYFLDRYCILFFCWHSFCCHSFPYLYIPCSSYERSYELRFTSLHFSSHIIFHSIHISPYVIFLSDIF